MEVRNLTAKPLGFGSTVIRPFDVGILPRDYDENNPTVKYYLSRQWIEFVKDGKSNNGVSSAVNVGVSINAGASNEVPVKSVNQDKPIERMNKEELQTLASRKGIELAETDTKQMIVDKIKLSELSDE